MSERQRKPGPNILTDKIRAALINWRKESGLSQSQAAQSLVWSTSKVVRLELGPVVPKLTNIIALTRLYGVPQEESDETLGYVSELWHTRNTMPKSRKEIGENWQSYADYEAYANRISSYSPQILPDILQVPAYARQAAANPAGSMATEALRQERIADLLGSGGPAIRMVIDEAALARAATYPNAFGVIRQANTAGRLICGETIEPGRNPDVSIWVMPQGNATFPFGTDQRTTMALEFDDADVGRRVYSTSPTTDEPILRHDSQAESFMGVFEEVTERLAGPEHTGELLDDLQARYAF